STGTVAAITLDPSPIKVTITASSKPPASTVQIFANFAFTTTDAISTVRCQLDTAPEGMCTSPTTQSYSGLSSGSHTFTVRAIDAAGISSSTSYTWTVTAQAPANTVAPAVSGQAVVGQVLTASPGTWTGNPAPTLTYQ